MRDKQILSKRARLISRYPTIWSRMIENWSASIVGDFAWLMYSANYLFRTNNVRWAIDPMTLRNRVAEAPLMNVDEDLQQLSVILLTHEHRDHLDIDLLKRLCGLSIKWIIPHELLKFAVKEIAIPKDRIIVPVSYQPIDVCGLRITSFPGLHWDVSSMPNSSNKLIHGVPSTGYMVEMAQKRWLFPGDTRTYDSQAIREFGPVDVVFAHLWLGRGCALMKEPPMTKDFCRFFISARPRRIVITHLEEFGRSVEDYWTCWHARLVSKCLGELAPCIDVVVPLLGETIKI